MQTDSAVRQIDEYLASLHKALGKLPPQARDDITKEIRSHILERVEEEGRVTEQTVNEVLRAMGDAREFASQYRTQAVLRRATTSKSPWTLLRATARSATTGLAGVVAFTATIAGYGCALVAYLCALLKPILRAISDCGLAQNIRSRWGTVQAALPPKPMGSRCDHRPRLCWEHSVPHTALRRNSWALGFFPSPSYSEFCSYLSQRVSHAGPSGDSPKGNCLAGGEAGMLSGVRETR
jgi:hypothetical protein